MTRVKRGNVARKRRKRILRLAKGFRGSQSLLFRTAKQRVLKSLHYAYIGRKNKKRYYRSLWIMRINASVHPFNITYKEFIYRLHRSKIALNRKMLAQLAILDHQVFHVLVKSIM